LIRDFCRGKLPALLDCTLNLIDVRDVATGLIRVMERGQRSRRYLLGGENLSLSGLLEMLSERCGVGVPRWRVPYAAGLAAAYIDEFVSDHVTGKAPMATVTGLKLARRIMHFDPSRSLHDLDLRPRPICESIDAALAWLRQSDHFLPARG
jgi:dihydroflavonol-4-reductase